jgi:hypothetical protein
MFMTSAYETASEALAFCKSYLEEADQNDAAVYLEGLNVHDTDTSLVAHNRLVLAQRFVNDRAAKHMVALALNAVERCMSTTLLAAS